MVCIGNPRWLFEIHSARACWGIDIWNRWRVLLDWCLVRPRWNNVCEIQDVSEDVCVRPHKILNTKPALWRWNSMTVDDTYRMIIPLIYILWVLIRRWWQQRFCVANTMLLSDLWLYNEWRRDIDEEHWILWFVIVLYDREFETVHGLPRSLLNQDYRNHDRLRFKWLKNKCNNKWKLRGTPIFRGDIFLPT